MKAFKVATSVWERDHRPSGQHGDTCGDSREPQGKGHRAGALTRKGFLEDGVFRAETYRLSGSEPTPETAGTAGKGNSMGNGHKLSKDLAALGKVEQAGGQGALHARLGVLLPNSLPYPGHWGTRGTLEDFQQGSGESGVSMKSCWPGVPPAACQACPAPTADALCWAWSGGDQK